MHIYAALCFFFLLQANFLCSGVKIREIAEVVTEKTEQDAFNKLLKLENKAKNLIESVIKRALPIALRNGQDADLSEECMGSFLKMIIGIKDMKLWAIKMIDATGKPGSGVLSGNLMAHGDYHQCLGTVIPVDSYSAKDQVAKTAKYCRVGVRTPLPPKSGIPETFQSVFKNINVTFKTEVMAELSKYFFTSYLTTPKIGVCVPSSCTDNDMRQILSVASKVLELYFELEWCEVKTKNSLSSTQITTCILLLIFPFMCLIATIYVEFVKYRLGEEYAKKNVSYVFRILLCFSLIDNLQRLMITRPSEKRSLDCIHGIRYITSTWVMLGHTYGLLNLFMLGNFFNVENILDDIFVSAITNGFLSVSSFFFITATLISFGVVKQFDKTKNFNFLIFLLRRIWRLLPDILVLIGIFSILPNISSGPDYKETIDDFVLNCKEYWWTNVFFFSNFIDNNHQCVTHTWYVSVDMQLFLVGFLYFFLLFKHRIYGAIFLVVIIIGSVVSLGIVTYALNFPPTVLFRFADLSHLLDYQNIVYNKPYTYLGTYGIGLFLGTFLARNPKVTISKLTNLFGWIVITCSSLALVYAVYPWNNQKEISTIGKIAYASSHRTAWAVCLAWVVFSCYAGKGGYVHSFLSWPGFQPLGKLSYLLYLSHVPVIIVRQFSLSFAEPAFHSTMVYNFFALLCISHIISVIIRLFYEGPCIELEKVFCFCLTERSKAKMSHKKEKEIEAENVTSTQNGNTTREKETVTVMSYVSAPLDVVPGSVENGRSIPQFREDTTPQTKSSSKIELKF